MQWITAAHEKSGSGLSKIVSRYVAKPSRVGFRYHCLEDFTHQDWSRMKIFNLEKNVSGADAEIRMNFFEEVANQTFRKFYSEDFSAPEEIIHVTCTGYVSPSAAQVVVSEKKWGQTTSIVHAYHMGCYAAVPAVKIARRVQKRIDIVHTELCSLHFNPSTKSVEQLVVQGLFADGLIRYSAFSKDEFKKDQVSGVEVLAIQEELISETLQEMTWKISDSAMQMTLSRNISKFLGEKIENFLDRLCRDLVDFRKEDAIFAIHPGGPLIIDEMRKLLQLNPDQVRFSEKILYERGNMSSATLPHIWKEIVDDATVPNGKTVISLAFGPGLTIVGMIGRKIVNL